MKTLIAYSSKYGCTEQCAEKLAKKLSGASHLYNIKTNEALDLSQYDKVIIGSAVYIGRIQKEAAEFCTKNLEQLKSKKLGLFICGSQEGDALKQELEAAYPNELKSIASILDCFGGAYQFSRMSFMEKTIVKIVAKTNKDMSNVQEDRIDTFAQSMNNL